MSTNSGANTKYILTLLKIPAILLIVALGVLGEIATPEAQARNFELAAFYVHPTETRHGIQLVDGTGDEEGFVFRFKSLSKKPRAYEIIMPEKDNQAGCKIRKLEVSKEEKFTIGNSTTVENIEYWSEEYTVVVDTEVLADSGGCLVWVKDTETGNTLTLVSYEYDTHDSE